MLARFGRATTTFSLALLMGLVMLGAFSSPAEAFRPVIPKVTIKVVPAEMGPGIPSSFAPASVTAGVDYAIQGDVVHIQKQVKVRGTKTVKWQTVKRQTVSEATSNYRLTLKPASAGKYRVVLKRSIRCIPNSTMFCRGEYMKFTYVSPTRTLLAVR